MMMFGNLNTLQTTCNLKNENEHVGHIDTRIYDKKL